ncbi:MAG: YeeE/YedE family protein, partial [Pseudomonadota bacterium]
MTEVAANKDLSLGPMRHRNAAVAGIGGLILIAGMAALSAHYGWRQGTLFLVGGALGVTLYHASFGFTGSWRTLIRTGKGAGVRSQLVMLAI